MSDLIVECQAGKVEGRIVKSKSELTDEECVNFKTIPFAKYERFEKPEPYPKWDGVNPAKGLFIKIMMEISRL